MSFELIIFDYDGVLIDSLDDASSVGEEFCNCAKQAGVQSIAAILGWQWRNRLVKERPDFIVNTVQELAVLLNSE